MVGAHGKTFKACYEEVWAKQSLVAQRTVAFLCSALGMASISIYSIVELGWCSNTTPLLVPR